MEDVHARLAEAIIIIAVVCAVWAAIAAYRERDPSRPLVIAMLVLSGAASLAAVTGLAVQGSGREPAEGGLHMLYGAAAVGFIPVALVYAREAAPRWRSATFAIAAVAVLIVAWRQMTTGGGA